jgi:excisionase family DNA binding protein
VEDYYSASEAAKLLGISSARVRQLLNDDELDGTRDPISDRWRVSRAAVHARREERGQREPRPSAASDPTPWVDRIAQLERELGRAEATRELTEQAHSTTREQLERERERADRLESELAELRGRGFWAFWARLFGG